MISSLNLETALRLAIGLSVPPESILSLMGKTELHSLILKAYPNIEETNISEQNVDEIPPPVLEINRLALSAYSMGRDLAPVFDLLSKLASVNGGRAEASSGNEMRNRS